jgi:hypothetical protein
MSQGHRTLAARILDVLIDSGTWMSRVELHAGLECSEVALDDALSDLVIEGQVDFRANVGYRLAGTAVCRRAAQLMRREGKRAAVIGEPGKDDYRVGVAEHRAAIGLVMYELAMPLPAPGDDALQAHLAQVGGVMEFVNSRGEANGGPSV